MFTSFITPFTRLKTKPKQSDLFKPRQKTVESEITAAQKRESIGNVFTEINNRKAKNRQESENFRARMMKNIQAEKDIIKKAKYLTSSAI